MARSARPGTPSTNVTSMRGHTALRALYRVADIYVKVKIVKIPQKSCRSRLTIRITVLPLDEQLPIVSEFIAKAPRCSAKNTFGYWGTLLLHAAIFSLR